MTTTRDEQLKVRLDRLTKARLAVAAEGAGLSLSEYVEEVVGRDVSRLGQADVLATQQLELLLTIGILVRTLLARTMGEEEASALLEKAQAKAREQVRAAVESKRPVKP